MKRRNLALVLLSAAVLVVPALARAQSNVASIEYDRKEEKKIRELYNKFEDSWNKHDVNVMADMWRSTATIASRMGTWRRDARRFAPCSACSTTRLQEHRPRSQHRGRLVHHGRGRARRWSYNLAGVVLPDGTEIPARKGH
jgi:hypothetical protein